jgi:hypothetical protein
MLLSEMAESNQSIISIEIVRHPIFLSVLEYLYTDDVTIPLDSAMELFVAADLLGIPRLQAMCERKVSCQARVKCNLLELCSMSLTLQCVLSCLNRYQWTTRQLYFMQQVRAHM